MALLYLDSSAIVKLVSNEKETPALITLLRKNPDTVSSVLARVEVKRAVRRVGNPHDLVVRADQVLERIALLKLDDPVLWKAAALVPAELRSLDAIHLAAAVSVRTHLDAFVTYDARLGKAAESLGFKMESPT